MTPAALQPRTWLLASLVARLLMALVLGQLTSAATILQPGEGLGRRAGGGFSDASSATSATRLPGGRGLEVNGKLYRLQLRYTACTGLVNQQYSHIAAFTLAAALGVSEVHLPPAAVRDSFGHKFSVHQEQNQMQWFPARASCLLDVERLQRVWARQGITVHEVGAVVAIAIVLCCVATFRDTPALVSPGLLTLRPPLKPRLCTFLSSYTHTTISQKRINHTPANFVAQHACIQTTYITHSL